MDKDHGAWNSVEEMAADTGEEDGGLRRLKKRTRIDDTGFPGLHPYLSMPDNGPVFGRGFLFLEPLTFS